MTTLHSYNHSQAVDNRPDYLTAIGTENDNTNVFKFLDSVHFRVSPSIMEVKKYTFGLKSITHNLDKIYNLLWNNLELEDSWRLIQAILRDLKGYRF